MFLGSCHDYYRMKKKNVQFINCLINELSSCLRLPSEYRDFIRTKKKFKFFYLGILRSQSVARKGRLIPFEWWKLYKNHDQRNLFQQ